MSRAARALRWAAFVITALACGDVVSTILASRLGSSAPSGSAPMASASTASKRRPRANNAYYLQPIVARNLFDIAPASGAAPTAPKPTDDGGPAPISALAQRFELVGTVVASNSNESMAVVQERAGAQDARSYAIGDRLADEGEIKAIESQRIILDVAGRREQIAIELEGDQAGATQGFRAVGAASPAGPAGDLADGIRRNPDGTFTLDSHMVENQLANLSELLTQARAVPNFEDGKTNGFRLFSIKKGSIFDQIGLRNGDVIRRVNENELNDPAVALNVFQELRTSHDFQVTVMRNNREETLSYQVR